MIKMGIETKYDYIYYTVLDEEEIFKLLREAGMITEMMATATATGREHIWIESLNKAFNESKDFTINNFRVDEVRYCDDIKQWCSYSREQSRKCPVFVKYNNSQPVKIEGEGIMFCLYEKKDDNNNYDIYGNILPDIDDMLGGYGGRL